MFPLEEEDTRRQCTTGAASFGRVIKHVTPGQ